MCLGLYPAASLLSLFKMSPNDRMPPASTSNWFKKGYGMIAKHFINLLLVLLLFSYITSVNTSSFSHDSGKESPSELSQGEKLENFYRHNSKTVKEAVKAGVGDPVKSIGSDLGVLNLIHFTKHQFSSQSELDRICCQIPSKFKVKVLEIGFGQPNSCVDLVKHYYPKVKVTKLTPSLEEVSQINQAITNSRNTATSLLPHLQVKKLDLDQFSSNPHIQTQYDRVILSNSAGLCKKIEQLIATVHNSLNPGGKLYLKTICLGASPKVLPSKLVDWLQQTQVKNWDYNFSTPDRLLSYCRKAGFRNIKKRKVPLILFFIAHQPFSLLHFFAKYIFNLPLLITFILSLWNFQVLYLLATK